ncbi:MAG: Bax inhibitor-1 family protein, partial [bacterium]
MCCRSVARRVPLNYILLTVFTVSFSFIVAFITVPYTPDVVIQAGAATALTTIALTFYALKTKTDMTMYGGALYILSVA